MTFNTVDPQWIVYGIMCLIIFAVKAKNSGSKSFLSVIGSSIITIFWATLIALGFFSIFWVLHEIGDVILWILESLMKPLSYIRELIK